MRACVQVVVKSGDGAVAVAVLFAKVIGGPVMGNDRCLWTDDDDDGGGRFELQPEQVER